MFPAGLKIPDFRRRPVFAFIAKRSGPFDGKASLTRDRVYIVPTRAGFVFSLLLLTLLIGSINYEKSLGFALTFLLVGIGNVMLLSTWRNIAGLELRAMPAAAVYAGETATFSVQLVNHQLLHRHSIAISYNGDEQDIVDCAAKQKQLIQFKLETKKRGRLNPGKFRLYSEFPGGLFVAWTWIDLNMSCIVYPAPDYRVSLPATDSNNSGDNDLSGQSMENYSHLRKYHHGDNISRISWKAVAKTDELFTREFTGAQPQKLWIDWTDIAADDKEQRLSIMTAMIIQAEARQQHYGLRLPQQQITPQHGNKHFHHCLSTLALF